MALSPTIVRCRSTRARLPILGWALLPQRVSATTAGLLERQRLDEVEGAHLDGADARFDVAARG
jgi:hypothetical protein